MATSDNTDTRLSTENTNRDVPIDISRVEPIFNLINEAESYGNIPLVNPYGIWHGSPFDAGLEDMTIKEVMEAQKARQEDGKNTPAGKYQILDDTLEWLVKYSKYKSRFDLDDKFDKATQDQLAYALLEHRGLNEFLLGEPGGFDNLKKGLATEWAGIPDETGKSRWRGVGVNRANATLTELDEALLTVFDRPEKTEEPVALLSKSDDTPALEPLTDLNSPEKLPSNPAVELGNLNIEDYGPESTPLGASDFDFDRANRGMLSEITDLPTRRGGAEILREATVPQRGGRIPEITVPQRAGRIPMVAPTQRSGRFPEASVDV